MAASVAESGLAGHALQMQRSTATGLMMLAGGVVVMLAACGGSASASEYADNLGAWAAEIDARLDAGWEEFSAEPRSSEATQAYLDTRVVLYVEAIEGFDALDPPEALTELDSAIRDWLGSLLAAEQERAAFAATIGTTVEMDQIWEGPATQAVVAAEEGGVLLCLAAQTEFDATEQREAFADVPWIPSDLKEVVSVALGCPEA